FRTPLRPSTLATDADNENIIGQCFQNFRFHIPSVSIIQGCAGSGKSMLLINIIDTLLKQDKHARILVTSEVDASLDRISSMIRKSGQAVSTTFSRFSSSVSCIKCKDLLDDKYDRDF